MNLGKTIAEVNGLGEGLPATSGQRTIPFDYAFRYDLEGKLDAVHNSTVTVSIEAPFAAVSIGYGVVPKVQPVRFGFLPKSVLDDARTAAPAALPPPRLLSFVRGPLFTNATALTTRIFPPVVGSAPAIPLAAPAPGGTAAAAPAPPPLGEQVRTLAPQFFSGAVLKAAAERLGEEAKAGGAIGPRTAAVLKTGFRLNPVFADKILVALESGRPLDPKILSEAFEAVGAPPDQIQFLYALVDEGTGREFQSEPILNTAGLGTANGMRPFRYFARPIEFAPRSVIRMTIIEKSAFKGELHVSLQGYKTLGVPGTPTGPRRLRRHRRMPS